VLVGTFAGTADLDPSPAVTRSFTSQGETDIFLARLAPSGDLLSVTTLGGAEADLASGMALDARGNLYLGGAFKGSIDFDPGAGATVLASADGSDEYRSDAFVASYAPGGALRWARRIGRQGGGEYLAALATDAAGNVYATGAFSGTVDFDPGPGVSNLTGSSGDFNAEAYVLKLDTGGNFQWARDFGEHRSSVGWALDTDAAGNVLFAGTLEGTATLAANVQVVASGEMLLARFDPTGRALSATKAGTGTLAMDANALEVDAAGNLVIAGRFFGSPDFDPGPGTARRSDGGSVGQGDNFFLLKLGRAGFPSATLHPLVLPEPGATSMTLTVTYSADSPMNLETIDSRDIRVLGPNNFSQPAALVSKAANADGTLTATYRVTPPGGTWDNGDNGVYTIAIQASQIASSAGQFVTAMTLGSFKPALPIFGDLNRDGSVNGSDFAVLAANFGRTGRSWAQGDMNGDGAANGSDFALLAANFGRTTAAVQAASVSAAAPAAPASQPARPVRKASPTPEAKKAPFRGVLAPDRRRRRS
jgi:hypothetical protein